nr:RNA-directed DNA polymerase, eukaryota, reverse transcriptase zinc-binding domain protein [Tanacetum cinerariifolium]
MDNIIRLLNVFYLASGLRVNINKSNVYVIGVSNNDIKVMVRITGCSAGSFPFTYLGLSFGLSMKWLTHWQSLVDKFEARLSRWKAKLLSIGFTHFDCKSKGVWANIIDIINHLHFKNIILSNTLSYKVGCGTQVRFWIDNWTGDSPLYHRYHRLYRLETHPNCSVSDRFSSGEWAWHWSRSITSGRYLDMIHSLKAELHSLSLSTDRDALRWASGLRVNINKSNVYIIGVSNNDIKVMARITGCSAGSFPFTYLGLCFGLSMKWLTHWPFMGEDAGFTHFDCKSKGVWANIIDIINHLHFKNIILSNTLSYKVGCGTQVRFRIDNWTGDSPLSTHPNCSVSDRFSSGEWAWHWSRSITSGRYLDMIHSLKAELHSLSLSTDRDAIRWGLTHDGSFTVGAIRKHIDDVILLTLSVETSWCNILPHMIHSLKAELHSLSLSTDRDALRWGLTHDGSFTVGAIRKHIDDVILLTLSVETSWCNILPRKIWICLRCTPIWIGSLGLTTSGFLTKSRNAFK